MRLKAEIVEIRQAMGKVRTRKEGSRWIMMAPREERLIPRDITKSTRRNISFVKMIKQSPTRLVQNGGRSSRKMYLSRSLIKTHWTEQKMWAARGIQGNKD
jgi:predicted Fe-S protein YdhL (DUF1289 family)